jgi:hypothetical protein
MVKESKHKEESKRPIRVPPPFHKRFDIKIDAEEARQGFLNRVANSVPPYLITVWHQGEIDIVKIRWAIANTLGKKYDSHFTWTEYVEDDFYSCLKALETVYKGLPKTLRKEFEEILQQHVISQSEIDLGISLKEGIFYPSGAKLLDEALVNESLQWLSDLKYHDVLEKGLRDFLESKKYPERLADTVRDMYEALEKMAKVVTDRPRDLSGNAELFVSKLELSDYYKRMLKDYISYANEFRHAVEEGKKRVPPHPQEVEAFIYTTGLFIRLAIERINAQEATSP